MNIARSLSPDGLCILTFDRPGSSANIFDRATLEELDSQLADIEGRAEVRSLVLTSAKPKIFIAGADLNAFSENVGEVAVAAMVDLGQSVFNRLARLSMPTVAAIHGTVLGGGMEVTLACDWRVVSADKATRLGLPETQLGILPVWGGATRLTKLIGLRAALSLIVPGKQISAQEALKLGAVDACVDREKMLDAARACIARGKRTAESAASPGNITAGEVEAIAAEARAESTARTRGLYPAPLRVIDVCARAATGTLDEGMALERAVFLELMRGPESRNLIRAFFLQDRAKKLTVAGGRSQPAAVRTVAVIGAGTMGAGIAQWASSRGLSVLLEDVSAEALERGVRAIGDVYASSVQRGALSPSEAEAGVKRVTAAGDPAALAQADLVIEAAVEQLAVKQTLFRELETRARKDALLASNTSALSIQDIASGMTQPGRVVGIHFFNPVHRMPLVEIVRGPSTSSETLADALQFVKAIGKLPVMVRDSPGFLVNRILIPYLVEAVRIFSEGGAVDEIDRLALDFGMPMGPLRLCDEVGLDVVQHIAEDLERRLSRPTPAGGTLKLMLAEGWKGKKSGKGFYVYAKGAKDSPNPGLSAVQQPRATHENGAAAAWLDRLVLVMVNEAVRVLEEGVVAAPEDVDFGMITGTGWAPCRGGPLRYAEERGISEIVKRLEELERTAGRHFGPSEGLRKRAKEGGAFYG